MNDELESQFPVTHDLGHEEDVGLILAPSGKPEKKEKTRTVYPRLTLDEVAVPEKDGYAIVKYHRCRMEVGELYFGDGEEKGSTVIEVREISFPDVEPKDALSREIASLSEGGEEDGEDEEEDGEEEE